MIFKEYKKLNLSKISDEILSYWRDQDIFKKSVEKSKDNTPFIFFEGPPKHPVEKKFGKKINRKIL